MSRHSSLWNVGIRRSKSAARLDRTRIAVRLFLEAEFALALSVRGNTSNHISYHSSEIIQRLQLCSETMVAFESEDFLHLVSPLEILTCEFPREIDERPLLQHVLRYRHLPRLRSEDAETYVIEKIQLISEVSSGIDLSYCASIYD